MEDQDKLHGFYDVLKGSPEISGMPDYENFKKTLSDRNKAKDFYDYLKSKEVVKGLPDDFEKFYKIFPNSDEENIQDDASSNMGDLENLKKEYSDFMSENKEFLDNYRKREKWLSIAGINPLGASIVTSSLLGKDNKYVDDRARYENLSKKEEELSKAISEHPDNLKERKALNTSIDESINDLEKELDKRRGTSAPAFYGNSVAGGYVVQGNSDEDQERYRLSEARKMYKDAKKLLNAPSKYDDSNPFENFMKGAGDTFKDQDFWSFGLTEIARNLDMKDIADKLSENTEGKDLDKILTPGEKQMLEAFTTLSAVGAERALDLSLGYSAGESSAESLKFMAEFLVTKGAASAASSAAKKAVSKWLVNHTKKGLMRELGKGIVWGTEAGLSTLARTPVMPSTYVNITDRLTGFDDQGNLVSMSVPDAILKGSIDSAIENFSEMSGPHTAATLKLAGKQAMRLVPNKAVDNMKYFFQKMGNSKLGDVWKSLNNPKVAKFLKETGYNGIGEEMMEEWYGNAIRSVTIDPNALKEFATWDNQLMTLASFLPMTGAGAVVSSIMARNANNKYRNSVSALEKVLRELGRDDEGVKSFFSSLDNYGNGGEGELRSMVESLVDDKEKGDRLIKSVADYLYNRSKSKVYNDSLRNEDDGEGGASGAQVESEQGLEGDDYAGTARLKDGREVTLQKTTKGLIGWLDDGNTIKITDDMISEYLPEESVRESERVEDISDEKNDKMYLNGNEVDKIEILGDGYARITDVNGGAAYFTEEQVKGYDENGVFVGETGNAQNFTTDKEGNLVRVEKNTNFDENILDNETQNRNRGISEENEGGFPEAGIQREGSDGGSSGTQRYRGEQRNSDKLSSSELREPNSTLGLSNESQRNLSENTYLKHPKKNGRPSYEPVKLRNANVEEFSEATRIGKRDNPHGASVDLHTPEEYEKMKVRLLSEDGKSGIAVEEDGNIVNLFSTNSSTNGASRALFLAALENGGVKGDNFNGHLTKLYTQMGAIPVARVKFNDEFAPDGWNYEQDGRPDIVFWMHNGESASKVAKKIGSYEAVDVESLPLFDSYDEAAAYRDKLLEDRKKENKDKSISQEEKNDDARFRDMKDESIDEVNRRFNEELDNLTEENADNVVLSLGKPSDVLRSAGISDKLMKLYGNKVIKKMKKHGFVLSELRNLPESAANPIAVFDNLGRKGNRSILTELHTKQGNFLVTIDLGKDADVDFNIVSSVFGKGNDNVVDWINRGLATYINKEKANSFLSHQSAPIAAAAANERLSTATNIVENFENPTLEDGEIISSVESLAGELNTPVHVVRNLDEIKDKDAEQEQRKRGSKGWYDPKTGEVVVVLPNAKDVRDAQATMLHEIVGHKGIRGLFGDRIGEFTSRVLDSMPTEERNKWVEKYKGNEQLAAEEYVAQFAEGYENPSMWEKIKAIFRDLLRDLGIDLKLSDNDLKYTLWRGVRKIQDGSFTGEFTKEEQSLFRNVEGAISEGSVEKIANLMNNLKNQKASLRLTSRLLSRYARRAFDADMVSFMGKRQFDSILRKIDEGVGGNYKKISNSTAEIFDERRKLIEESISEKDAEKRKELNKKIKEFDTKIEDVVRGELDGVFKQLADVAVRVELKREKARFDKLTHLKLEGKNQSGVSVAKKVDEDTKLLMKYIQNHIGEDMSAVIAKLNSEYDGKEMSRSDEIKLRGALVLQKYFESDNSAAFIEEYIKQKNEISEAISELKEKINEEKEKTTPDNTVLSKLRRKLKKRRQELKATEEILFENRAAYLSRLRELNDDMKGFIDTGKGKFMDWVNEELERKRTIFDEAMRDMDTRSSKEKADPLAEEKRTFGRNLKSLARKYLLAPAWNLNFLVKHLSRNAMKGEGEFYDRIFKGKDGLFEAYTKQWTGLEKIRSKIDDKVKEIFGKNHDYLSLMRDSDKQMKGVVINYNDPGKSYKYEMKSTYGNALYIVMIDKMSDASQKLRKIGIDEDAVEKLRNALPADYIKFADWIQGDLLPELREKYNKTHLDLFGSSMANIQNYFPLKMQESDIQREEDISKTSEDVLPSSVTGSIIKRKPTTAKPDIKGTNAFEVLLEYARDMEHWNAFARVNKDLSTLLSNRAFRNMLRSKDARLPERFKTAAQIAVESYRTKEDWLNELTRKVTKGFTAAKISFRFFTAWKQVLSAPTFLVYSKENAFKKRFYKYMIPHNFASNWKWAMENLPLLEKRWKERMMGNEKLDSGNFVKKLQDSKFLKSGMLPNAFIDALTCASGARAVYEYKLEKYNKLGIPKEEALRRARIDAEIAYNETQQSAEGAMLSHMQKSRNLLNAGFSVFNNSNFGYLRKMLEGVDELRRKRESEINSRTRVLMKMGVSEEKARKEAERETKLANREAMANIRMFGFTINVLWTLGGSSYSVINSLCTLIGGDDDKEKEEAKNVLMNVLKDLGKTAMLSPIQGIPFGKNLGEWLSGYEMHFGEVPGLQDLRRFAELIYHAIDNGEFDTYIGFEVLRMIGEGITGVDLNTAANMYLAIDDLIETGGESWIEDLGLFMNVPQSQIKTVAMKKREGETYIEYEKRIRDLYVAYRYLDKNMSPWLRSELKNRYYRTPEERETRKEINRERNKREREKAKEKERNRYKYQLAD